MQHAYPQEVLAVKIDKNNARLVIVRGNNANVSKKRKISTDLVECLSRRDSDFRMEEKVSERRKRSDPTMNSMRVSNNTRPSKLDVESLLSIYGNDGFGSHNRV